MQRPLSTESGLLAFADIRHGKLGVQHGEIMPTFLERLGIELPIVQAPMAGVSTPEMAAAVSNAGALGSIAVGAVNATRARTMIAEVRRGTERPFNVNVFVHEAPKADAQREGDWLAALAPTFQAFDAAPPASLRAIYKGFNEDDGMVAALVEAAPPVISFHFGLPAPERITWLKAAGAVLIASVTSLEEGLAAQEAGMDALVAQGFEAGGHRGIFNAAGADECLSMAVLTRLLVKKLDLPVIAAGGIAAALDLGAVAAQLGTAFVVCAESSADAHYRATLLGEGAAHTVMTTAISGRPARCLANRFTELGEKLSDVPRPDYPIAYDAGKALHAAASARGEFGYGAQWAGQGAPLARSLPAGELVGILAKELRAASGK